MTVIKCRINNLAARNIRRDPAYQMVLIDLANAGAIDTRVAEALLGYKIPDYINLPKSFESLDAKVEEEPKKSTKTKKAATPVVEEETVEND